MLCGWLHHGTSLLFTPRGRATVLLLWQACSARDAAVQEVEVVSMKPSMC